LNDLLPPEKTTMEAAGEALIRHFDVRDAGVREVDRTFYDTFDGLLHAAGLTASLQDGQLVIRERDGAGEVRSALAVRRSLEPATPLLPVELEPGPPRDALVAIVDVRALLPLARVHSRERSLDVLDAERKTVARMTLEEPALVSASSLRRLLRPRLRLAAVRGYESECHAVRRQLERELGYLEAEQPLVDEAVSAAGGPPAGTSSKVDVALEFDEPADSAAAAILRRLLEVMDANLDGTIADLDSEFLHDFRVAVRRSRSVQRELRGVFPPGELATFRAEFRWLQQATGDARDLDVYVLEFDDYRRMVPEEVRSDLDPLLGVLRDRRRRAHDETVRALRSERAAVLHAQWAAFLDEFPRRPTDDRPAAKLPVGPVAGERIRRVYRQMVKMGRAIDHSSPPEHYHELRKRGKELRYLLELFGAPLYPSEVVKPMIRALKALQDVLGRHQDREIQVDTLRSLRDEVFALPGGAAALMAMGMLVQRLAEDQQAARGEFAEKFAAFASSEQRHLVKDAFS
jgi:CHAD domain-containing protein